MPRGARQTTPPPADADDAAIAAALAQDTPNTRANKRNLAAMVEHAAAAQKPKPTRGKAAIPPAIPQTQATLTQLTKGKTPAKAKKAAKKPPAKSKKKVRPEKPYFIFRGSPKSKSGRVTVDSCMRRRSRCLVPLTTRPARVIVRATERVKSPVTTISLSSQKLSR